jgi:hypothetical protein
MFAWHRSVTMAVVAATFLAAAPASAQPPADQADRLNDEGKKLFAEKDYERAYGKFREAATLSPEGRYFFNMCYALNFLGRYQEAIQACEQVEAAGADKELSDKTRKALASLREKAAAQRATPVAVPPAGTGTDPGADPRGGPSVGPTGPPPRGGPSGPPPSQPGGAPDPFVARRTAPEGSYKWSIGGSLGGLGNINVGRGGDFEGNEVYGEGGADLRFFANVILSERFRLGLQGSLAFGSIAPEDPNMAENNLFMADIGGAAFVHLPIGSRIVVTPLFGPMLSVQQPNEVSQGFIAGGLRAELGLGFLFGRRTEHQVTLSPALNVYFPASGEVDGADPADYGLDTTHSTFGIAIGYSYRFSTPFGAVPLITLE